ncbi:hypothetical protein RirG_103470 [Rhizophagus irregularis DAOM 197198w]|uniref:CCHC-type domain-containing protein n=2 Tax=Rhizophagus irregularis TaxID=588596 RepID=A0A015JGN4_RHIIW|nr:hypothetical protein RirG_103470 [Rhizophagus irregularis DAOM 197198w]
MNNMATPTPPISQRTRSGTAKNLVQDKNDGDHEVFSKKKEPDNIVTPLQTNINEPLEPKEASSRRELRKKKQQVSFNTNKQVLQNTSSPVFLVSSPEKVSTNTVGQSTDQNLDVNNDASNKQTSSSAIGQTSVDHNNITSNDQIVNDQQVILPDIEMIMDEQEDDTNQFHKLENSKIIAILKVPINNPDNIDEYKKFMKIVQNSILEDSMLKQEDIISLQVQIMTQKVPEGTVAQMNDNQKKVNKIITGISLQATLISQQTWKDLQETPYRCDGIDYFFEEVITNRTRQKQNNGNSQDRVVQVFNASLRLTTAIIKPFMRKYGELEEEKCYSRRPHAHAPNRQVVYITFKDANSVHRFYDNHVLWIYGEMLYVTPFLMDKNIREGLKQFCMKLNGLPPNAQAVEFKEFIDHHSVVEFYIPRNTYTNDTQKYAYVYFKDEAAMVAATQEIFLVRNKQTEWSDPSVQSCFRCGYTGHYMRDCDYVPPRTRPMRKNEYFRQIKEIRQNRFARNRAINYSSPATYAQMAAQSNRKFRKRDYNAGNTRNGNQNDRYVDRSWNRDNINHDLYEGDDDNRNSLDDEEDFIMNEVGMHEWDEQPKTRPNVRSRDVLRGTQKGGSIHMKDKEKEEWYHRQTNDNLQDIKNDFAKIKDMMDCMYKEQAAMRNELNLIKVHSNPNLKDTTKNTNQNQSKKRGGVVFNSNNKRTRNEESSGSESNAANNVYILSNRMDQADDTMKKMMDMLQNMSTKFEQIYNNQENNANNKQKSTVIKGDNNALTSTNNNI